MTTHKKGKIGLIDVDGHNFPNLALMKLSAYYKKNNYDVEFVTIDHYDKVFASKVFTFTQDFQQGLWTADEFQKCGTGYFCYDTLPSEIEHIYPDYSLYNIQDTAYGFLTRGCSNNCSFCVVPKKEGPITPNTDITEFWHNQKYAILLDNNILSSPDFATEQFEKLIAFNIRVDFNQGLDARILANNSSLANLLSRLKWKRYIRFACDHVSYIPFIDKSLSLLNKFGVKNYRVFVYVLVRDVSDISSAYERVSFLKKKGCRPFAQPFFDPFKNISSRSNIHPLVKKFVRWVNRPEIFNSSDWSDYKSNYHSV